MKPDFVSNRSYCRISIMLYLEKRVDIETTEELVLLLSAGLNDWEGVI